MFHIKKITILFIYFELYRGELYSQEEFDVIRSFGKFLGVRSFAFVQNDTEVDVVEKLRDFFNCNVYSVVFNPKGLGFVLSYASNTKYFERKTVIVTKNNLNFSSLIQKESNPTLVYWLVFTDDFGKILSDYIPANVDLFAVRFTKSEIQIKKLYHLKSGMNISMKDIGTWSRFSSRRLPSYLHLSENFNYINFENLSMKALVYWSRDFCLALGPKLALDRMECFQQEMMEITAQKLNFTINIYECPERLHPYNYPNGTLSELFALLRRKKVDLSMASYVIDNHRLKYYDFAWPTFTTRTMMYIKLRKTPHWKAYLGPLNSDLWAAMGCWIIGVGLLNIAFEVVRSKKLKNWKSLTYHSIKNIFIALQMFCNQGTHFTPKWYSNRLIYLTTFFISLTIYQGYSGHLISSLTIVIPNIPFTDLNSFFQAKTYKLITLRAGFHHFYLQKILDQEGITGVMLDSDQLPFYSDQGIAKICSEDNLAFIEFRENLVQHNLPCKITEIPRPMLYQSVGIGFPKNSPYQEYIKRELTVLHSTGILQRMRTHLHSYVKVEEKDKSDEDFLPVTLRQVVPLFCLLGLGIFVSIIVYFVEVLHYKFNK